MPAPPDFSSVSLEERYTKTRGRVLLTGNQALVRLTMLQRQRDLAAGLNTAGYVSGYRGSPLAGLDHEFERAKRHLGDSHVVFHPGINEDLAATAVWGTQQLGLFEGARYDGVFSMWYGKGPGLDRSLDAVRHANAAGTSPTGGVLLLAGDDHGAVSSTVPHQSEQNLISAMVPVLSPGGLGDFLDFGLMGWAMSRYAGLWVGFKCVTDIVESTASFDLDPAKPAIVVPDFDQDTDVALRWPDAPRAMERRLLEHKLARVQAFARANRFDAIRYDSAKARLGIVASGKAWLDLMAALEGLGIDEQRAEALGLRVYKVGLVWPLEPEGIASFAKGLERVLVVEEKRGIIEDQIKALLFDAPESARPKVIGKRDADGRSLLPEWGEIDPGMVANALADFIDPADEALHERAAAMTQAAPQDGPPPMEREAYFCSGCPHSISTRLPEGSRASTGIGCHMMVIGLPERRTSTFTQMGGEGVAWTGMAPFTDEKHIFVNMGDGTYFHSGLLAIRAAVASGANATYKILYNDAVALTGGQVHDGPLSVPAIVEQVLAERVARVAVVAEEPERWRGRMPAGVSVSHRDEMDAVQRELREVEGISVIVFDQVCAAEKRRRRKKGAFPKVETRAFINELVCEGCGDCSVVSNCISVEPVETEFGTKRRINQSSCNGDLSCVKGFCPSFVTVTGGALRRGKAVAADEELFAALAEPPAPKDRRHLQSAADRHRRHGRNHRRCDHRPGGASGRPRGAAARPARPGAEERCGDDASAPVRSARARCLRAHPHRRVGSGPRLRCRGGGQPGGVGDHASGAHAHGGQQPPRAHSVVREEPARRFPQGERHARHRARARPERPFRRGDRAGDGPARRRHCGQHVPARPCLPAGADPGEPRGA